MGRAARAGRGRRRSAGPSSPASWRRPRGRLLAGAGSSSSRSAGACVLLVVGGIRLAHRPRRLDDRARAARAAGRRGRAGRRAAWSPPTPDGGGSAASSSRSPSARGSSSARCRASRAAAPSSEQFRIPTERRGIITVGPARTVRADPIGLVRREIVLVADASSCTCTRAPSPSPPSAPGFIRDLEGIADAATSPRATSRSTRCASTCPATIAASSTGRATAKTGTFMVRQFEETRRSQLMVLLDLDPGAYADDAEFELAVSAAASVGARAIRDARTVSFVVSGRGRERRKPPASAGCASCRRSRATGSSTRSAWSSATTRAVHAARCRTRRRREPARRVRSPSWSRGTARGVAPLRAAASRLPGGDRGHRGAVRPRGRGRRAHGGRPQVLLDRLPRGPPRDARTIGIGRMSAQRRPVGTDRLWPTAISVLMVVAMLAAAMIPWWPIYESGAFVVAASLAIIAGSAIAVAGAVFRWPAWSVVVAVFGSYLAARRPRGGAGPGRRRRHPDAAGRRGAPGRRGAVLEAARDHRGAGRLVPGAPRTALPARAGRRHLRGDDRPAQPAARRRDHPARGAAARRHRPRRGARRTRRRGRASRSSSPRWRGWSASRSRTVGRSAPVGPPTRHSPTPAACSGRRRSSPWPSWARPRHPWPCRSRPGPSSAPSCQPPFEPRDAGQPARGVPGGVHHRGPRPAHARGARTARRRGHPHRHARHLRRDRLLGRRRRRHGRVRALHARAVPARPVRRHRRGDAPRRRGPSGTPTCGCPASGSSSASRSAARAPSSSPTASSTTT